MGDEVNELAIETEDRAEFARAQAERVAGNHLEHRLGVRGRARDDPEDLAGGGLLLEGLGEVAVPGLELLEEAHVLDGDHGLIRERLQEPDLLLGKRPDLHSADENGADGGSLP